MKNLTGLDATFLHLETPETPMHVGSLHLFDLPADYPGDFYDNVKKHVANRMHLAEVFYRKLTLMPLEMANPVWVDDDVDLDYHIKRVKLPRPGTMAQLEKCVGNLHSTLIDRNRPLWELYIIEGFHTGQLGLYIKMHHAAVDGAAGIAVAQALLDITAEPREVDAPAPRKKQTVSSAALIQNAVSNAVTQYANLVSYLPQAAKSITTLIIPPKDAEGNRRYSWLKNLSLAPKTPINGSISNQRSIAAVSIPFKEVKQIAKGLGLTINDIVLALSSGALRQYLTKEAKNGLPTKSLIAAVPVSLREANNTDNNNQISMILCNLATNIDDPLKRLQLIKGSMQAAKAAFENLKGLMPTDYPSFGVPWFMSGLASLDGRSKLSNHLPPIANVAISNVPGPPFPLYLAGARMATYYPLSIVTHGMALNITVESYNGSLDFGFTACRQTLPNVGKLARYLVKTHAELKKRAAKIIASQTNATAQPPAAKPRKPAIKKVTS
jgi:WS/DGAT/MGAT family acyltransferase